MIMVEFCILFKENWEDKDPWMHKYKLKDYDEFSWYSTYDYIW